MSSVGGPTSNPSSRQTIQNHGTDYYLAANPSNSSIFAGSRPDANSRWLLYGNTPSYSIRFVANGQCLYASSPETLGLRTCSTSDEVWKTTLIASQDGTTIQNTAIQGSNYLRIDSSSNNKVSLGSAQESNPSPDYIWTLNNVIPIGSLPPIVVPPSANPTTFPTSSPSSTQQTSQQSSQSSSSSSSPSTGAPPPATTIVTVTNGQTTSTQTLTSTSASSSAPMSSVTGAAMATSNPGSGATQSGARGVKKVLECALVVFLTMLV